jgi:hypothetical protein
MTWKDKALQGHCQLNRTPSVQPQHGVAYLPYERRSSGEACALLIPIDRPRSCHGHLHTTQPV